MLDSDLAAPYGVTTKRLNQQLRRNRGRFPADFAFQLRAEEVQILKSQIVTSSSMWGGRRYPPVAFTEHGAVMLASVLNSPVAVEASIQVVRAFVQLRSMLAAHADLAPQAGRAGAEVRLPVPGGIRRDPPADGAATGPQAHRVPGCPSARQSRQASGWRHDGAGSPSAVMRRLPGLFSAFGALLGANDAGAVA